MTDQDQPWWHSGVIYQIYPRSWADADGDGIGDLPGISDRLDYLTDTLGVEAIWLSPFYPSPQADFGYDVSDYCDVDPIFGDLAAFDRLVSEAHRCGLKVIIDFVPNHTSDQHPWFIDSRSSASSNRRDWYVWADPGPAGGPPNNWTSMFGGSAWEWDELTGQYYLHSFLVEQPDLNWRNPDVEGAMMNVLRFWLDRGVDGFRIDVAQRCMKDPLLRDNPPAAEVAAEAYKFRPEYAAFDHIHDSAHPDIHTLFRRIRATVDSHSATGPKYTIGEIHEYDWRVWGSYHGWTLDELHQVYNFIFLPTGLDPVALRRAVEGMLAALPSGAWPNWVIGNHDEPRAVTRYGREGSRAAAVLLLTLIGTPTIYYGDEIGLADADIAADQQQDPWGARMPGFGRDGCRTPMQWGPGPTAGFGPPGGQMPWLPVSDDVRLNVEAQRDDPSSHLSLYRRLLQVRRERRSLQLGGMRFVSSWDQPNPLAFVREHASDGPVAVVVNLSGEPAQSVSEVKGSVLAGTDNARWGGRWIGSETLQPWEAVVVG